MSVLLSQNPPNRQKASEVATQRSVRIAMILSLSILVVGGAYYVALYVIAH